ncbi:MAG TPA: hypothetical protein VM692_04680 [Gammaproteobacteria bacterium]|nr:hypothetical protein [Gammaproteobacteria bacterium]
MREVDARVWAALCAEIEQPDIIQALADAETRNASDSRDWNADVESYRAHLERLKQVEATIMRQFRRGLVSEDALAIETAAAMRERKMVEEQLATAERAAASTTSAQERLRNATAMIERLRAALPNATLEQRQALLRELTFDGGARISLDGRVHLDLRLMRPSTATRTQPDVRVVRSAG